MKTGGVKAVGLLGQLFLAARMNPQNPLNQPGRLMGRHCQMRLQRAQARRGKGRRKCNSKGKAIHVKVGRRPYSEG